MKKTSSSVLPIIFMLVCLISIPCFGAASEVPINVDEQISYDRFQKDKQMRLAHLPAKARERISQHLQKAEYELSSYERKLPSGKTSIYRAFNRKQHMTAYFTDQAIRLIPNGKGDPAWHLEMTLSGYGYEGATELVRPNTIKTSGQRIEYRRGALTEWYVNNNKGLEQGVTLDEQPADKKSNTLVIEWIVSGSLKPRFDQDKGVITFYKDTITPVLTYTGLYAFDATGKTLPARLALANNTLRILVDDKAARYPITIDPWVRQASLTASDGAIYDELGSSVAISGDTVVVGAPRDRISDITTGSAYVFVKPAEGWADMTETAKLTASDGAAYDEFGFSVSISGDTVVVGARGDDIGDFEKGSAYVFVKPVEGWSNMTETAKLTASDVSGPVQFGISVAVSGDTVVVGDRLFNGAHGLVYVFVKPVEGWSDMTETARLSYRNGHPVEQLGTCVAISGDTVVAGAPGDNPYYGYKSSVYVYEKPAEGWSNMTQTAKLTVVRDDYYGEEFAVSVSISGDTVVVGDTGGYLWPGFAYVFEKPVEGWSDMTETAKLTPSFDADDYTGYSVSISGDTVVVGPGYNVSAFVYKKPVEGWTNMTETDTLTAYDGIGNTGCDSVGISGGVAVVGVGGAYSPNQWQGKAVLFSGIDLCEGDFDSDGDVDGSDLAVFAADFGRTDCSGDCEGDFDSDNDVDGSDLAVFAADFGRTDCP